ncbi:hypothetical protein [Pedosphaera parvula]|uniref:Uncharacterized protein n=1 Tax=Pedosphaera parvula (strain Ellin514) TaxID=320771 RepID=B9X9M7_PEDPL|nr:hypothetical protein [Pedosphaera parvula]EEF63271.1 hypothetical protein Cflav_PD5906 [Pedosphaera parvula Ellin514]
MSILASLTKRWNYSVECPGSGRLLYREGNREFIFPAYEEDGVIVLAGVPSSQRVRFFFNWYKAHSAFTPEDSQRILPRIRSHLNAHGVEVRIFAQSDQETKAFEFYPELFECRSQASAILEEIGFNWFSDYGSIDILHHEYGLEICGIHEEESIEPILLALQQGFPQWHHFGAYLHDYGREQGWALSISLFPAEPCGSGWIDEN